MVPIDRGPKSAQNGTYSSKGLSETNTQFTSTDVLCCHSSSSLRRCVLRIDMKDSTPGSTEYCFPGTHALPSPQLGPPPPVTPTPDPQLPDFLPSDTAASPPTTTGTQGTSIAEAASDRARGRGRAPPSPPDDESAPTRRWCASTVEAVSSPPPPPPSLSSLLGNLPRNPGGAVGVLMTGRTVRVESQDPGSGEGRPVECNIVKRLQLPFHS
mmetsp:Transcript_3224/g.8253  ORF Transcript_3224/g.8253 Transcript_3224/m.8253 type:complete len:212 (+) Transcript_3224:2267-2902(+)